MESLTCIKSCGKNELTFFETNRLVPCLGCRDYFSLFSPVKCPYTTRWHKIFGDIPRNLWAKMTFQLLQLWLKKKKIFYNTNNTNNRNCLFLNCNSTYKLFLALKRCSLGTQEWPPLLLPATAFYRSWDHPSPENKPRKIHCSACWVLLHCYYRRLSKVATKSGRYEFPSGKAANILSGSNEGDTLWTEG